MNACSFSQFEFYGCLDRVERELAKQIRWRFDPPNFLDRRGGMAAWPGFDFGQRVRRVQEAIAESQGIALRSLQEKLGGINLQTIWPLLADICHDLALYIGGGAIAGAAIGTGLGFMVLGIGAIPGAVAGTALGAKLGGMLLNLIGLKSVIEHMLDNVPLAIEAYQQGFVEAWGADTSLGGNWREQRPSTFNLQSSGLAANSFARGHEIIIVALLMGIVAYLARGKGNLKELVAEAQANGRLGPKFATWLEENASKLTASPMLQSGRKGGGQADSNGRASGTAAAVQANGASNSTVGSVATNGKRKLSNLFPPHPSMPGPRNKLVQTKSGAFKYQMPSGELRTPKGVYDFIQIGDEIKIAPPRNDGFSGHLSLSKGADVDYAGTIQFSQKGVLKWWDNNSGHYRAQPGDSSVVKLPANLFKPLDE